MPVIPLLPLFHRLNYQYFENSLTVNNQPLVKVRWSDNRLKTTAGFYKRKRMYMFAIHFFGRTELLILGMKF